MKSHAYNALKRLLHTEMFKEKWHEYRKKTLLPIHNTPEQYAKWLKNTKSGKKHKKALDDIDIEIEKEINEFFGVKVDEKN